MRDFRKGNDLMIKWSITTKDGSPYPLPDKSLLRIEAHTSSRSVDSIIITLVSGNVVTAMYYGKDQKYIGDYTLTLIERDGMTGMHTIDECNAFRLSLCDCASAECECTTDEGVEVTTVELESTLVIGIDNTEGGGTGLDIDIIKSGDFTTSASDSSVYSSAATDERFLNKVTGGTVKREVTFNEDVTIAKAIKSGNYDPDGNGFKLYTDESGWGILKVDKLQAKSAFFDEIVINQINFQRGTTVFSCAGCTIEGSVENVDINGTPAFKCYYDNKDGKRKSGFEKNDLARCQRFDKDFNASTKYYWRKVLEVGDNYVVLSHGPGEYQGDGTPEAYDDIVQFGNTSNFQRQSAIVITPYGTDIVEENTGGGSVIVLSGLGAGDDPFAVTNKNYIGLGVKTETTEEGASASKAYIYGYGDMYFGDRGENAAQYIEYKDGKLNIKGNVTIGGKDGGEDRSLDEVIEEADTATANAYTAAAEAAEKAEQASATAAEAAKAAIKEAVTDGTITASDIVVLKREQKYIYAQHNYITGEVKRYKLSEDSTSNYYKYNAKKVGYDSKLAELISGGGIVSESDLEDDGEDIKDGVSVSFLKWQRLYYESEAVILSDISNAAKALAEAAKTQADEATDAADKAVAATGGLDDDTIISLIEKQSLQLQLRVITEATQSLNTYWAKVTHNTNFPKVEKGQVSNGESQKAWLGWYASDNKHEDVAQEVEGIVQIDIAVTNPPRDIVVEFASDAERDKDILFVSGLATSESGAVVDSTDVSSSDDVWKQTSTYGKEPATIFKRTYAVPYETSFSPVYYLKMLFKKDETTSSFTDAGYYRIKDATSYYDGDIQCLGFDGSFHLLYARLRNIGLTTYAATLYAKADALVTFFNKLNIFGNTSTNLEELESELGMGKSEVKPYLRSLFADYFDYVDACEEAIRQADLTDVEYIKEIFPNNLDVDGASLAYLLGVKNDEDTIVAGLYGGASLKLNEHLKNEDHGTLMFFAGAEGVEKATSAATRIYEDGTIYTEKLIAKGADISGTITTNEGVLGGLSITQTGLSYTDPGADSPSMQLGTKFLKIEDGEGAYIYLGEQTSSSGSVICRIISECGDDSIKTRNVALSITASSSSSTTTENTAINIDAGCIKMGGVGCSIYLGTEALKEYKKGTTGVLYAEDVCVNVNGTFTSLKNIIPQ